MKHNLIDWRLVGMIFAAGATMAVIPGCGEDSPLGDVAKECGLTCPADGEGIIAGNFSISGVASIDAFFGSVVNVSAKANLVAGNIDAELAKIKARLGLDAEATAEQIKAKIVADYQLDADASLMVKYVEPKCEVSVDVTIEATARCDVNVEPGSAKVECKGSCEVEASAMAECTGDATLKCTGTATGPNLECMGDCSGTCELTAAAECSGTCKGTCEGTCSAENADGSCNGTCEGTCQGTCEMNVKGECSGQCKGTCEYEPPSASGMCEGGATVKCEASASGSVECNGKCEGEVTPPSASAECEASAKAEAQASVECTPPELSLEYTLDASLTGQARLDAEAKFEAFLTGFVDSYGKIVAELKRADIVLTAAGEVSAAAGGALDGAFEAAADGSLKAKIGVGCAIAELEDVPVLIGEASDNLEASVSGAVELTGVLSGS
jgi:modification target Cys-rich repeat protein